MTIANKEMDRRDFFVSYAGPDEHYAEWVAWHLENEGYSVIIQKWDFRPGHNFVLMMDSALRISDKVVIILSESYLEHEFPQPEWAGAFAEDPLGLRRRVIPVRIEECKPSGLLKAIIYIDLTPFIECHDKEGAIKVLLNGISISRAKPNVEPIFPVAKEIQ